MKCIRCEEEARAVCQFCGRAVCKTHIGEARFVSGFTTAAGWMSRSRNAVVVENAVWCGVCKPEHQKTA